MNGAASTGGRADDRSSSSPSVDLVIPTIGRPSLGVLLRRLDAAGFAGRVLVVDDRRGEERRRPLALPDLERLRVEVRPSGGRGPAAARNVGWRAADAPWVAFVDDDVVPSSSWPADLARDLAAADEGIGGVQGRLAVPLPHDRGATDRERDVAGLADAAWITADMAYRREALLAVGGFDERFPRAYREDADLALRVQRAGWRLAPGSRTAVHPVAPAPWWSSVARQAGNADDALLRRLHGSDWRRDTGAGRGTFARHAVTTAAAVVAVAAAASGRRRPAAVAAVLWLGMTARFAWQRIAPGPRTPAEIAAMLATSVAIPPAAVLARLRGERRWRDASPWTGALRPAAVLLDRDGTIVEDVPYNGDPDAVRPVADAATAIARLRAAGIPTAVVTNQSGIARGLIARGDVDAVRRRVEELLGPLGPWFVCPHGPDDACACRKPAPGLVLRAARALDVRPADCVVVGDTIADVEAALAAGARAILVPNDATAPDEPARAPAVARSLSEAVDLLLGPA